MIGERNGRKKESKWKTIVLGLKKLKAITLKEIFLLLGMFLNPFGFDAAFALVMKLTNSYWITDAIFYCLSGLCFGAAWLLSRKKPA